MLKYFETILPFKRKKLEKPYKPCTVIKLLKATWKGKKLKEGFEATHGNGTRDLLNRKPQTNQLR